MKTYKVELTEDMIKVISAGLGEIPAKHSLPVISELNRQIMPQMKPEPVENTEEKSA